MELAGLAIAVVTCVIIVYALPARIARRHAVVSSREGDRFSSDIQIIDTSSVARVESKGVAEGGDTKLLPPRSTRPLLPGVAGSPQHLSPGGSAMEDVLPSLEGPTEKIEAVRVNPVQAMAALRARRVARMSREKAAATRRIVAAGFGSALFLLFTVLGATGTIGWAWLVVPALFLVGALGSSIYGASLATRQNQEEIIELEQIKSDMKTLRQRTSSSRPAKREPSKVRFVSPRSTAKAEVDSDRSIEVSVAPQRQTDAKLDVVAPLVEAAKPAELAEVQFVADEPAQGATPVKEEMAIELRHSGSTESSVTAETWEVVPLPEIRNRRAAAPIKRKVHADTDLVPIVKLRSEGVPARPVRVSQTSGALSSAGQATGPTFRFDLDAVLEQRRAQ